MNQRRRRRLTDVARGVLGGMKQEAENGRRKASAADFAVVKQRLAWCRAKLVHRRVDDATNVGNNRSERSGRITRLTLGLQRIALRARERLTTRIGKKAIECPASMPHVETDRGSTAGTTPDMFGRNGRDQALEIFARLNQSVHDRHQQRLESGDRAALPGFSGHEDHCTRAR